MSQMPASAHGMKPVLVFRHALTEGPGHFATFLDAHGIAWRLVRLDEGEQVPASAESFAGLAFMGGPMSANDELPWTAPALALIRDAVHRGTPVIGHCLGGQLLSRALGGEVTRSPVKEIGWHRVRVEDSPEARAWLGDDSGEFTAFQWHGETFTIPPGGRRILLGERCANQAYVVDGIHLGMQCHVEMTEELVRAWCASGADEVRESRSSPAVQWMTEIEAGIANHLPSLTKVANRLYGRWIRGLR
jgi:GMP synthase-like glutamine amidotransferase